MGDAEAHCREVLETLFQYIDGEMDDAGCAAIRRHIELCASCMSHIDFEIEIKRIVRTKCSETGPPAVLVERVRAFLRDAR
jgi:mycothiol system anti-sigma-R factor